MLTLCLTAIALTTLLASSIVLSVLDLRTKTIPTRGILVALGAFLIVIAVHTLLTGELARFLTALLAAAVVFAVALTLAVVSLTGLGGGDVKLFAYLGCVLGWYGWVTLFIGMSVTVLLLFFSAVSQFLRRMRSASEHTIAVAPLAFLATWGAIAVTGLASPELFSVTL